MAFHVAVSNDFPKPRHSPVKTNAEPFDCIVIAAFAAFVLAVGTVLVSWGVI